MYEPPLGAILAQADIFVVPLCRRRALECSGLQLVYCDLRGIRELLRWHVHSRLVAGVGVDTCFSPGLQKANNVFALVTSLVP